MKLKRHCDLCDHQKLSLEKGITCGVTNKKPSFNKTCTKIDFGNNLLDLLEDILIEYEDLKLIKKKVCKNYFLKLFFGVIVILFGFLFWKFFVLENYRDSLDSTSRIITIPIAILSIGFIIIKIAINKLNKFKRHLFNTKNSKLEIDEVLNLYNQKYKYRVKFDEEIHGTQDVEIDVVVNRQVAQLI